MDQQQHETVTSEQLAAHADDPPSIAESHQHETAGSERFTENAENPPADDQPPAAEDVGADRTAQLGVIFIALGIILTLIGLFPGIAGTPPIGDVGQIQITVILGGFCLQIFGAWVYVRFTFYPKRSANLVQQIGLRLTLTGLLFSLLSGFADILGFGSHGGSEGFFFGRGQAVGLVGGFFFASIGLLIFALSGQPGRLPKS